MKNTAFKTFSSIILCHLSNRPHGKTLASRRIRHQTDTFNLDLCLIDVDYGDFAVQEIHFCFAVDHRSFICLWFEMMIWRNIKQVPFAYCYSYIIAVICHGMDAISEAHGCTTTQLPSTVVHAWVVHEWPQHACINHSLETSAGWLKKTLGTRRFSLNQHSQLNFHSSF